MALWLVAAVVGSGWAPPAAETFDLGEPIVALRAWAGTIARWLLAIAAVALGATLCIHVVLRRLGPVDSLGTRRLGVPHTPRAWWLQGILSAVLLGGVLMAGRGVLAGAARSVAASPTGIVELWSGWLSRGLVLAAAALTLVAAADLLLDRHERWRALFMSRAQLRRRRRR